MLHHLLISLPFMVCFFWSIFFLTRRINGSDEPRVSLSIILFYLAATILYFDHVLYYSGIVVTAGEWSYGIVNLCVYPFYYAYLRALTRTPRNWELPVLLIPAVLAVFLFPIGRYTAILTDGETFRITRICFAFQVVWVLLRGYQVIRNAIRHMDDTYSDDRSRLLRPNLLPRLQRANRPHSATVPETKLGKSALRTILHRQATFLTQILAYIKKK